MAAMNRVLAVAMLSKVRVEGVNRHRLHPLDWNRADEGADVRDEGDSIVLPRARFQVGRAYVEPLLAYVRKGEFRLLDRDAVVRLRYPGNCLLLRFLLRAEGAAPQLPLSREGIGRQFHFEAIRLGAVLVRSFLYVPARHPSSLS